MKNQNKKSMELKTVKQQKKIDESKNWFFEKTYKIDTSMWAKQDKEKEDMYYSK